MVSHDSSTEDSASSMDEKENRFFSRVRASPYPLSSSSSLQSESLSDSSENVFRLPQKKILPARTAIFTSKSPSSSVKRPRNEDDEPRNVKTKKPKPTKEEPKQTNADKRNAEKTESLPSLQKSAKKPIVWNPKEEVLFLKAIVAYCQYRKEFPENTMTSVFDYVRNHCTLDHEYSNPQLGEKLRRLLNKFIVMDDKVKEGGYSFKTPHDETVYKLSKNIWGRGDYEQPVKEAEVGNGTKGDKTAKKVAQDEKEEEDAREEENKKRGNDMEMTQKENDEVEEEDEEVEINAKQNLASAGMRKCVAAKELLATPNVVSNATTGNGVQDNNYVKQIYQLLKENSVIMNEFKYQLSREKKPKIVREGLHSSVNGNAFNSIGFTSEEVVKKIYSARELLALDVWEARMLEQKWQRQVLAELEVCSGHLALLQEECQKCTEKIRSFVDEDTH